MAPAPTTPVSAASAAVDPLIENFELPVSYAKIGDTVYSLSPIGTDINVFKEVKEYYKEMAAAVSTRYRRSIVRDSMSEWQTQINHIATVKNRSIRGPVAVPQDLLGKTIRYDANYKVFGYAIPVIYHPWKVVGMKSNFERYCTITGETSKFFRKSNTEKLEATIKSTVYIPATLVFYPTLERMVMPDLLGYHSMSDKSLCYAARNFKGWLELDPLELSAQLSIINLDSPARRILSYNLTASAATEIPLETLINDSTLIDVKTEVGRWTT